MLELVASSRPVFNPATPKITFTVPTLARRGDVLLIALLHAPADGFTTPSDWTAIGNDGASVATAHYIARMVDAGEPDEVVISLLAASAEWQGQLFVLRGAGSMALLKEASASATYTADATPAGAACASLQAINLAIVAWSSAGALTTTPPAGFDLVDDYSTALVGARSATFAIATANATGTITPGDAASSGAATGRAFTLMLRDGLPIAPAVLSDLVPGNIGLLGRDDRPPREVPFGA